MDVTDCELSNFSLIHGRNCVVLINPGTLLVLLSLVSSTVLIQADFAVMSFFENL